MTQSISKTFCILPWVHLSTRPDGSMRVCCTANASSVGPTNDKVHGGMVGVLKTDDGKPNNLNVSDFQSAWNSTYMKNVRLQMLAGEQPPSCLKCYKEEDAGHNSKRMWETKYWIQRVDVDKLIEQTDADGGVPPQLAYIDLRFGTKCQLACVMCSPHDSSGWIKDYKAIFPEVENASLKQTMLWTDKGSTNGSSYNWHKQNPVFWQQFYEQIPHMQQIYFAGGESLIIEEHYEILEECIRQGHAKNLELRYNSNGVEWREDLFDLWKHFKKVKVGFSIDDIGDRNYYIRYPSDWDVVVKNLHTLDNTPNNIHVSIATAIQILNVKTITELAKWKIQQNFKKVNNSNVTGGIEAGGGIINMHLVYIPTFLSIKCLPADEKEEVRKIFAEFANWLYINYRQDDDFWKKNPYGWRRWQAVLDFMDAEDHTQELPALKEYLIHLDSVRKTDFKKTFPFLKCLTT